MENWVLNSGQGAYREKNFGEGEQKQLHFGFEFGKIERQFTREWKQEDDIVENDYTQKEKSSIEVEMEEGKDIVINGITEYGYGLWSRFVWNSE